jgi:hypothetical protein
MENIKQFLEDFTDIQTKNSIFFLDSFSKLSKNPMNIYLDNIKSVIEYSGKNVKKTIRENIFFQENFFKF